MGKPRKTIWKYPLEIRDMQHIEIPRTAKILCAKVQRGRICVWAQVNRASKEREFTFYVVGTGNHLPFENASYLDTVFMAGGELVWHIYYDTPV